MSRGNSFSNGASVGNGAGMGNSGSGGPSSRIITGDYLQPENQCRLP